MAEGLTSLPLVFTMRTAHRSPLPANQVISAPVVVARLLSSAQQRALVSQVMERAGVGSGLSAGDQVFLKPNLTYPRFSPGVTTRAEFVEIVAEYFLDRGCRVTIGEGPGGYNGFSMRAAFDAHGISEMARRLGVGVVELSEWSTETLEVRTRRGSVVRVPVSSKLRHEFNGVISLPVPKVHCMTGVSLGVKNLWGCIPDVFRVRFHPYFDDIINELLRVLPVRGVVLDGMFALDENGPMVEGVCRRLDWVAASRDCGSHDVAVASLLGFNPMKVSHLSYGVRIGTIPSPEKVQTVAMYVDQQRFRLKRHFWNRVAALTWLHPWFTWVAYLSPFSGLLHWLMYLIRARPSDLSVRGLRGWRAVKPDGADVPNRR